jgi:hypothetical protein
MGGRRLKGHIDPRNMRREEMSRRQGRMGASCEEGQGRERAADRWMI